MGFQNYFHTIANESSDSRSEDSSLEVFIFTQLLPIIFSQFFLIRSLFCILDFRTLVSSESNNSMARFIHSFSVLTFFNSTRRVMICFCIQQNVAVGHFQFSLHCTTFSAFSSMYNRRSVSLFILIVGDELLCGCAFESLSVSLSAYGYILQMLASALQKLNKIRSSASRLNLSRDRTIQPKKCNT